MKLNAEAAGERHEVEVRRDAKRVVASVDARRYELEVLETGAGAYLLLYEGRVYACRVDRTEVQRESVQVSVGNHVYNVILTDPKRLRHTTAASAHADGNAQIVAQMPGKVVRVLVEVGREIEAGAGVVVVEAMKMQNEMKSPKAGKVTSINTAVGATVNAGDVLAVIE